MTELLSLAVVLINWNDCERTLQSIGRLGACENISMDIFVVDNGSTDNSVEVILKKYPDVHLLENNKNAGFAGGNNLALERICSGTCEGKKNDYVLLLNTDAGIACDHLKTLVMILQQRPDIGVLGPVIAAGKENTDVIFAGGRDPAFYVNTYHPAEKICGRIEAGKPFSVDYVSGTVALIRVAALQKSGLFAEEYFFSCEMADLCERIKKHFICAVTPQVTAWHEMETAGKRRQTLYLYYILRNRFLFIKRCKKRLLLPLYLYWIAICAVFLTKSLVVMKFDVARAIGLALADGLSGRYGGRNDLFVDS